MGVHFPSALVFVLRLVFFIVSFGMYTENGYLSRRQQPHPGIKNIVYFIRFSTFLYVDGLFLFVTVFTFSQSTWILTYFNCPIVDALKYFFPIFGVRYHRR